MGSVGNQNPWAPYDTYKDCSQGICSIYCPQWCYIIFPPPPPFTLSDDDGGDDSGTDFSPLIIAVIGILASAFVLVSYYTIISKYCRRRNTDANGMSYDETHRDQMVNESLQGTATAPSGLDEMLIKSITVCKYKKGDGFVEGSDCSVCLSEFQENDSLRLLPKCNHAFHLPCIDTWLKSHASCPLCRAHIVSTHILPPHQPPLPPAAIQEQLPQQVSNTTASALEYQYRINDGVVVIQDLERGVQQEAVLSFVVDHDHGDDHIPKPRIQEDGVSENVIEIRDGDDEGIHIQPIRRSVSLNSSGVWQNQVSIADILGISEEEEEDDDDVDHQMRSIDKNKIGILNMVRSPLAMKRSISTGRFTFTRYEKGKSSIVPN